MRTGSSPILAVLALAASPTLAQQAGEAPATVEQAVARTISDALPDARYSWALDWSAFGSRLGHEVHWHLAPPIPYLPRPLPAGVHRRTGWLNVRGASGDVAACGDADRIGALSIEVSDTWLGQSDVLEELASRGVPATLLESREAVPPSRGSDDGQVDSYYRTVLGRYPAFRRWRLERTGHEPATLVASHRCTPPGTRSATRCSMTWTVFFDEKEPWPSADPCLSYRREDGPS